MGRTRTAVGRTNAPSRSESRAGDNAEAATGRATPLVKALPEEARASPRKKGVVPGEGMQNSAHTYAPAWRHRRLATPLVKALPEEAQASPREKGVVPGEGIQNRHRKLVSPRPLPPTVTVRARSPFVAPSAPSRQAPRTPQFGGYDSPKPEGYVDERMPPTPDFAEPEKVVESNMTALKRCRHKLNVHNGGAKKFFLNWNTKHDGNLSRGEMYQGFNHLNLDFTAAQADFLVRAFDADQSNSVEYHEFCKTMEMTDDDILAAVGAFSHFKPPPWIKPKGWEFNPYELNKIKRTQMLIQERMHQTFGGNPKDIRDAFLYMDKSRSGALSKDDFLKAFKRIGVDVKPHELELMLGHLDNKDQNHKIPYTNFVKNFEAQPAGSFNPFRPTERVPGTEHVTKEQLDSTGAPLSVQRKWNDSYGRDPRYRSRLCLHIH
jgi:Ca2+-binding EF-hand superfamily protein